MDTSPETNNKVDSGFVCDCDKRTRRACTGEPFYKEREDKRYCVLHYPGAGKTEAFLSAVQRKLDAKDYNFDGVWFPDDVSFSRSMFDKRASFRLATFNKKADFSDVTFGAEAHFEYATFKAEAIFSSATFISDANFNHVTFALTAGFFYTKFSNQVNFDYVCFDAEANFMSVNFGGIVYFSRTKFKAEALFNFANFDRDTYFQFADFKQKAEFGSANFNGPTLFYSNVFDSADFTLASFSQKIDFGSTIFHHSAKFNHVTFKSFADFRLASFQSADFSSAAFQGEADFRSAGFSIAGNFGAAVFGEAVRFSGSDDNQVFGPQSTFQFARMEKPDHVYFQTLTLCPGWFVSVDVLKLNFINVEWTLGANLKQEVEELEKQNVSQPYGLLATTYRQLAIKAEEESRYDEASRFRYRAMDARRLKSGRGLGFWNLGWWYWFASGYGEQSWRAFMVLLGVWLLFGGLYTQVGFVRWEASAKSESEVATTRRDQTGEALGPSAALAYSLGLILLQKPEPQPATRAAHTLVLVETFLGPLQAALLALAIRRKFMR